MRGVGLLRNTDDLASVAIRASGGVPVFVRDVATVKIGDAFRVASLVNGTKEAVGGVIVARSGANARQVIDGVKAKLDEIRPGLPAGVSIVPFYDRSELIDRVLGTLRKTLLLEILLVTLAHVVFLLHFRSILIVTLPLPLAVLLSFLAMQSAGVTSNLMSLAGIAIAIGVLVDAGIVVTENAFREIQRLGIDPADHRRVSEAVRQSLRLVGPARVLLDEHHPARVRACVRADGAGGQALPPAGIHEDVRGPRGDDHGRHARARAVHAAASRPVARRGAQSRDADDAPAVSARARGGAATSDLGARPRP